MVVGLRNDRREVMGTTMLDAEPLTVYVLPQPTLWPFLSALAGSVVFIGILFHPVFFIIVFSQLFCFVGWFWPCRPWRED
ncbi:MAG: hypothetical protein AB8I58_14455 [Anaerolineales bacterium]